MSNRLKLTSKYVAIVEGDSDCNFLRALLLQRGLQHFQVVAPSEVADNLGGASAFARVLSYLPMLDGFDDVEGILLVSDNDDSPDASFGNVIGAIKNAEEFGEPPRTHPVPANAQEKAAGKPAIVVYMIPGPGLSGNLETLCLSAAKQAHAPLVTCVDELATCAELGDWSVTQQAKAQVRAFVAIAHQARPDISLTKVWSDAPHLFPMHSNAFNDLAAFLQTFPQLVANN